MPSRTPLAALCGAIGTGILVLLLRYRFLPPDDMLHWLREYGYWAMWVLVGPGLGIAWRQRARLPLALGRLREEPRWVWLVLSALALLTLVHEPRLTKINYDEHVLLSISRSMHLEQKAAWVAEAKLIGGSVVPTALIVDKRPVFYPFVLSLVHKATGYRLENMFWLNGALCITFLLLA